jgi:broad-specificity NMP kinase
MALAARNSQFACKTLFPELFYTPFAEGHKEIFRLIDSGHKKIAIAAPRGIGKTTIARAIASRSILLRNINFIAFVSNSATSAEMQTENIKSELSDSEVRKLFGDIKVNYATDIDESFSKKTWTAFGSTLVLPRGAGQQVRGLNWRGYRPQLIIVDDLENSKEVLNELNRKTLKNWFFSDLMKSVNRYQNDWRIIYIDTIKHERSLLSDLLEAPDWAGVKLSLCTSDYKSLFPAYMTNEEIALEVKAHRESGMMDTFYMEFMNQPISLEDAVFKSSYFRYYDETEEKLEQNPLIENVVIVDPAKTVNIKSAESAIINVAFERSAPKVYFRDLIAAKLHPDEIVNEAINMAIRSRSRVLAVEVTGIEEFITHPFKAELARRNLNIEFVELRARGRSLQGYQKKEDRIAQMGHYYRRGLIYHNKSGCMAPLEAQLVSFPRSGRIDAADAAAYFIELLELGEKYFYSENDPEPEPFNEALLPREKEPALTGWRLI